MGFSDGSGISWTTCKQPAPRPRQTQRRRQGGGGLGRAKPSQLLKLAPTKHDGRSSATCELPQKIFACWRFSHSRAGAAISRTLAILNSAGTNFINYLLKVKVRTEWGKFAAFVVHPEAKRFSASGGLRAFAPLTRGSAPPQTPVIESRSPCPGLKPSPQTWYSCLAPGQTTTPSVNFYKLDALPDAQPTVSKNTSEEKKKGFTQTMTYVGLEAHPFTVLCPGEGC